MKCQTCGKKKDEREGFWKCDICDKAFCRNCVEHCTDCNNTFCEDCGYETCNDCANLII